MGDRIRLTLQGKTIRANPVGYLGNSFQAYRDACARGGARYNPTYKANDVSVDGFATFAQSLRSAGFELDITPDLAAWLQAKASEARALTGDADARALALDAKLKEQGLALFGFQRVGVKWLAPRASALLLDQQGLGKSVQTLVALPEHAAVLVICPAVAKGVWLREAAKWRPDLKVSVLSGRGSFRWPSADELVVTNYDILPDSADLQPPPAGVVTVCDEAQAVKGSKTLRTKRTREILSKVRANGGRTWGLTGTPLMNRPPELWGVLTAFGAEREVFGSWPRFVEMFNGYKNRWNGYEWGKPNTEVGNLLRRVSLRRLRTEVLQDLPGKTITIVPVDIDKATSKLCDEILQTLAARGIDLAAGVLHAEDSDRNLQFEEIAKARAALATAKIGALLELVESYEEQDEPLVVFSAHLAPLKALAGREGWALITGETSATERTRIENDFQAGKLRGVAASIKAGGVAITLTRACHALFVDLDWTPAWNAQAEDRVCRIGQTRPVQITRLIANHALDERICEVLGEKMEMIARSVERSNVGEDDKLTDVGQALQQAIG